MERKPFYRRRFLKYGFETLLKYPYGVVKNVLYGLFFFCPKLRNPGLYLLDVVGLLERGRIYEYHYRNGARGLFRAGTSDTNVQSELIGYELYRCFTDDELAKMRRVVDLGGQTGIFTLWMLNLNKNLSAVCVEAVPENAAMVKRNFQENRLETRATLIEKAAWSHSGESITIHLNTKNTGGHSIMKGRDTFGNHYETAVTVETISLDDIVGDGPCDFLKIDIEGSEYEVFRGVSRATLAKIPRIIMETHRNDSENEWLMQYLREQGYVVRSHGVHTTAIRPS